YDLDVAEGELPQTDAERLHDGLLGGEARRQVLGRVALAQRVRALGVAEEPLGQLRATRHRETESVDLDHGRAEAEHRAHARAHRSASTYTGSVNSSTGSKVDSTASSKRGCVSVTASLSAP